MSTATGRGRLFFQAVGDPTTPSQFAPKRKILILNRASQKSRTCVIGSFWIYCTPGWGLSKATIAWFGQAVGGSCGTLVIYKRNQQANVQFGLETKSRTCVIAILTYIRGNGHIKQFGVPIRSRQAVGDEGKTRQIRHLENLESAEKAIFRKSS